jgi:ATP-dependent Zn protease
MVEKFGMSELGPWTISSEKGEVSGETRSASDKAVQRLTQEAYNRSKQLLTTNRAALDKVAAALLEHETLTGEEIKLIVQVRGAYSVSELWCANGILCRVRVSTARVDVGRVLYNS